MTDDSNEQPLPASEQTRKTGAGAKPKATKKPSTKAKPVAQTAAQPEKKSAASAAGSADIAKPPARKAAAKTVAATSAAKPAATSEPKPEQAPGADTAESAKKAAAAKRVASLKKTLAHKQAENRRIKPAEASENPPSEAPARPAPAAGESEIAMSAAAPNTVVVEVQQDLVVVQATPERPNQQASAEVAQPVVSRPQARLLVVVKAKAPLYFQLMRLDKPIGILLLLWPTLWALWLAAKGLPSVKNLVIFVLGVLVMRSAGCVINDFADRKIDGRVARTRNRPLATGAVSSREAITLFIGLCLVAFGLVLCTDPLTIKLSVGGLLLAFCYPFMKRHTHLPQVVLGAAFAWGIPMAYAAQKGALDKNMWLIYSAVVLWTVVYDTFYAMVDREDDRKIGVKSTAILFGEQDRVITGALQLMVLYALILVGRAYSLGWIYYAALVVVAGLFAYQQWLIRKRVAQLCFNAFLNNNWVGAAVFAGIVLDLATRH